MFSKKDAYEVSGKINGIHVLQGKWNEYLSLVKDGKEILLWKFPDQIKDWA